MGKKIEIIGDDVIVFDGNTVQAVKIDENNPRYQELKAETNNFTENMIQKNQAEEMEVTQADLIMTLMMNGVI